MSNFLYFAKRFVDIVADMHLIAAYDSIMIPRKRVNLSSSVTTILVLASLTPSTPGFKSYLIGRYQSVHVVWHSSTTTLSTFGVSRGSVLGPLLFFYIYLLSDIVRSFNVQHRQYADDPNTMQIFISLSNSTSYAADISNLTHSFTHCLSTHDSVLIAWF